MIDNKIMVQADPDFALKTFACQLPITDRTCLKLSLMDSHGRVFAFEDPDSTQSLVCNVQEISVQSDVLPSNKVPVDGPHTSL